MNEVVRNKEYCGKDYKFLLCFFVMIKTKVKIKNPNPPHSRSWGQRKIITVPFWLGKISHPLAQLLTKT